MNKELSFPGIGTPTRGKVRDIYILDGMLLVVTTDRISAFDVVMSDTIPGKGEVLTKLSSLWFNRTCGIIRNHLLSTLPVHYPPICKPYGQELQGRSMLVKKANPLPVECVVRGYLSGSAWKDYRAGKPTCGITLPPGLKESDKLPEPIFTPTTKVAIGHDEAITFEQMAEMISWELASKTRDASLALYSEGAKLAEQAGIIIADTKFEFGLLDGELILIDELLTPDSSRFWPADSYRPGGPQPSFDKQYLRDYLVSIGWNQRPPAPPLPAEVINMTAAKYAEAWKRLSPVLTA